MINDQTDLIDFAIQLMVTGEDPELYLKETEIAMDDDTIQILLDDMISTGG